MAAAIRRAAVRLLPSPRVPGLGRSMRGLAIRATPVLLEHYKMPVPNMGDSITEGVIVEWSKGVGDYVFEDDVFCVIETDKARLCTTDLPISHESSHKLISGLLCVAQVSVDIKAPKSGTLAELVGEVDDTVYVGDPFAVIDTDGVAPEGGSQSAAASAPTAQAEAPPPEAVAVQAPVARQPSIKFRHGKREEAPAAVASTPVAQTAAPAPEAAAPAAQVVKVPGETYEFIELPPNFGRLPALTEAEEELVRIGGSI